MVSATCLPWVFLIYIKIYLFRVPVSHVDSDAYFGSSNTVLIEQLLGIRPSAGHFHISHLILYSNSDISYSDGKGYDPSLSQVAISYSRKAMC